MQMQTNSPRTDGRSRDMTPEERRALVPMPLVQRPTRRQVQAAYDAEQDSRTHGTLRTEAPAQIRAEFWRLGGGAGVARRNARQDGAEFAVRSANVQRGAAVSGTGKPKGDA
mgnify:CR=1 FL=1